MRFVALLILVTAGCSPSPLFQIAGDRLGAHGKHLHLVDRDRIEGSDVYTFCRAEHRRDVGGLTPRGESMYDGACVTLVCPAGDDGQNCR
jgi:hypothetical protein